MQSDKNWSHDFDAQKIENDEDKLDKKRKLVRNEFEQVGKYGMPLVKKQNIDINAIEPWGYSKAKPEDTENKHKTIHFFTHDWAYENVYQKPEAALEKLHQYYALLTPDFSTYTDMPIAVQIHSVFKNRWCGAFWQMHGLKVIPTIEWGDERSFEFCFDGVEQGAVVAVSTYYKEDRVAEFLKGYNKMLEVIRPSAIICYGNPFDGMGGKIKFVDPYNHQELIKKLGMSEYLRKYLNGDIYPSN